MDRETTDPRQAQVGKLRSDLRELLAETSGLSSDQRALLARALDELETTVEAARDTDDELRRLLAELTAAHDVVEAERERYRDLFQFAPNGYLVTDLNGRIREANRAAAELLQTHPAELVRALLATFVAASDRATFEAMLHRIRQDEPTGEWEVQLQPPFGGPIDASVSVAPIRNRAGRAVGLRWLVRDVTERKRLEASLQLLSEASAILAAPLSTGDVFPSLASLTVPRLADWCLIHLRDATDAGPDEPTAGDDNGAAPLELRLVAAVARTQSSTEYLRASSPWLRLDDTSVEPVRRLRQSGLPQLVVDALDDFQAGLFSAGDQPALPRDVAIGSAILVPLVTRARQIGVLTLARDRFRAAFVPSDVPLAQELARRASLAQDNAQLYQEARRARQQSERREKQLAEFIRMVAHDVQQPLSAAHWHLQAMHRDLARGNLEGAQVSEAAIGVATERLDAMIRDLVESARLEVGQLRLNRQPIDLATLVESVARQIGPDAGRVVRDLEPTNAVSVDPERFTRVIENLLGNALKYSPAGSAVVVRLREQDAEVMLSIADHGIGIAPEDLPYLFDRGYRTATAATTAEGLGMGLYITRLLVEAHGGRVWATSEPGQGSTFVVALPALLAHADDPA